MPDTLDITEYYRVSEIINEFSYSYWNYQTYHVFTVLLDMFLIYRNSTHKYSKSI